MKVKNIVFSGFAAAILMGTAAANADPVFNIASRAYVDSKVSTGLVDNNENPISIADALAAKADTSDVSTLDSQINGNGGLADDVSDLQDALGSGFSSSNTVANAIDGKQNKLGGEGQNGKVVTATSTPGTVTYTTVDSSVGNNSNLVTGAAVQDYVAGQIQNVTGNATIGTLPVDPNAATQGASYTTVGGALADMNTEIASKQAKSDSTISAQQASDGNHLTAGTGVAGNLVALDSAIGSLETTVNTAGTGLSARVGALETATSGVSAAKISGYDSHVADTDAHLTPTERTAMTEIAGGYSDCITAAQALDTEGNGAGAQCVLSVNASGVVSWVPVTFPWAE